MAEQNRLILWGWFSSEIVKNKLIPDMGKNHHLCPQLKSFHVLQCHCRKLLNILQHKVVQIPRFHLMAGAGVLPLRENNKKSGKRLTWSPLQEL